MKLIQYLSFLFLFAFLITIHSTAQISTSGKPFSFSRDFDDTVPTRLMAPVNVQQLVAEDRQNLERENPLPPRFGFAHEVNLGLNNAGHWTEMAGGRLWRLRIVSAGAYSINFIFDEFYMPEGASLFIYNDDRSEVIGAFTELNNKPYGKFSTQPVSGSVVTLEYYEPEEVRDKGRMGISKVIHAYRNLFGKAEAVRNKDRNGGFETQDFGDSGSCNVNINCSQGNSWQDDKHAVAMVLLSDGTRWCSGSLINNEREDYTPYFLSAFHCADISGNGSLSSSEINDAESWVFMFNYESPTCSNSDGQTNQTVSGAFLSAGLDDSDFLLMELSADPPYAYDPYFAGWSRSSTAANNTVGIHHPNGDVKKISIDDDSPVSDSWPGTPSNSHWEVYFEEGTVEHGSSGSPLFDQNHRIVGQLHGNLDPSFTGQNYCEVPHGWYGKFSLSWSNGSSALTRLEDWLDPDNTGVVTLDGTYNPEPPSAPTNFTLTNPGNSFPSFSWDAVPEANSYKVYQRCDYGYHGDCGPYLQEIGTTTSTSYTDYSVIQGGSGQQEHYEYAVKAVNNIGLSDYSNRDDVYGEPSMKELTEDALPKQVTIEQNYPNPFNPVTKIKFGLPEQEQVQLVVYDMLGRVVQELVNESLSAGFYTVTFNADRFSSGVYFYKLQTSTFSETRSMTVIK